MERKKVASRPLITVIVTIFNAEKYLRDCVDSVVDQTYRDLQILLVDDGSSDRSREICDQYADLDDRVSVFHKIHGGPAEARNTALKKAEGDYIALMCAEDTIEETFLERLYNALSESKADLAISGVTIGKDHTCISAETGSSVSVTKILTDAFEDGAEHYYYAACAGNKLYRKKLLPDLMVPGGKILTDTATIPVLLYKLRHIASVADPLYHISRRPNSWNDRDNPDLVEELERLDGLEALMNTFHATGENRLYDAILPRYIECSLRCYLMIRKFPHTEDRQKKYLLKFQISYKDAKERNVIPANFKDQLLLKMKNI